jgi:transcriptional regulator with XRE-family HTH domain
MKRLGERIKYRREKLQMQLNELAKKVGVTPSALSQIENGKSFPTIITLKSVAENLHTTVGELIGENETLIQNPILRQDEIKFVKESPHGVKLYLLSHHDVSKQMETYMIKIPSNVDTSELMTLHQGQEFIYVKEGELEFGLDNRVYVINQGDNVYYNSSKKHYFKNKSASEATLIWIVTPPNI